MQSQSILLGSLSAALVVLSGALYSLLFALGKLRDSQALVRFAFAAYAVLFVCAFVLGRALGLGRYWIIVIVVMLIGYLITPMAVWHLCVGTHAPADTQRNR